MVSTGTPQDWVLYFFRYCHITTVSSHGPIWIVKFAVNTMVESLFKQWWVCIPPRALGHLVAWFSKNNFRWLTISGYWGYTILNDLSWDNVVVSIIKKCCSWFLFPTHQKKTISHDVIKQYSWYIQINNLITTNIFLMIFSLPFVSLPRMTWPWFESVLLLAAEQRKLWMMKTLSLSCPAI